MGKKSITGIACCIDIKLKATELAKMTDNCVFKITEETLGMSKEEFKKVTIMRGDLIRFIETDGTHNIPTGNFTTYEVIASDKEDDGFKIQIKNA